MMKPANLRVAALIAMLIVYVGHQRAVLEAAPTMTAPIATEWCANICDEAVSCSEPCLVVVGQEPAMEVTCGQFDGGPTNDWCDGDGCAAECSWWSLGSDVCWWEDEESTCEDYGEFGECGDDVCVAWQGEDCDICPEDCGGTCPTISCGNSECELGESWRNCPQDCDPPPDDDCGNGTCGPEEDGDNCPVDCASSGEYCGPSPYMVCDTGWVCMNDQCVWNDPNKFQCCGGAACATPPTGCPFGYQCVADAQFFDEPVCLKIWGGGS